MVQRKRSWMSPLPVYGILLAGMAAITANAFALTPSITISTSASARTRTYQRQAVALEDPPTIEKFTVAEIETSTSPAAAATPNANNNNKLSWQEDGFIFGLEGSGLQRPKGRTAVTVVEGDSLETQPYQVAIVAATFAAHSWLLASSFADMLLQNNGNLPLTTALAATLTMLSWLLADFGSGVLHWSVDNYGNGRTPIMGGIIAAFQGHHSAPWTIAQRGFCNNVYKLCTPFGLAPVLLTTILGDAMPPSVAFFLITFCIFEIMSQEFHKWSHQLKSETPSLVNWLQEIGFSIRRAPHAQHHLAPFEGNYCIISGVCNPWLDETGFFRRLEHVIYEWNGVESNAWKLDPELRKCTLARDYRLPAAASASSGAGRKK